MKIGYRLKIFLPFSVLVAGAVLLCLSCSTYLPYRTDAGDAPANCPSGSDGELVVLYSARFVAEELTSALASQLVSFEWMKDRACRG
ncbi:MAG: hypothetical protein M3O26_01715 [Pseudomonadota bacterium]|nr:hypothetical protein [Pseudomonadota bacterium]